MKKMFAALAILVAGLVAFVLLSTNPVTDTVSVVPATQASHPQDLPSFQTATGEAVPQKLGGTFITGLVANVREPCPNPATAFLERAADLRSLHDEAPEELQKVLQQTEDVVTTSRVLNGIDTRISTRKTTDVWFEGLLACANLRGEDELLKLTVASTFAEEQRPPLKKLWMQFLLFYPSCDPAIFTVVQDALADLAAGTGVQLPGGIGPYKAILLADARRCPDRRDQVFATYFDLLAGEKDPVKAAGLMTDLVVAFPYSPEMRAFIDTSLQQPAMLWGAIEMVYLYACRGQLGESDIRNILESQPAVFDQLLAGGSTEAWATYKLLAEHGGQWGSLTIQQCIADPSMPANRRADAIDFLGEVTAIPWSFFQGFLADPLLAPSAVRAIGQHAATDDQAYAWLRNEVTSSDPGTQLRALEGLAMSGREDLAAFLAGSVFPLATGQTKAYALGVYAAQPGADPEMLERLARPEHEPDPDVRGMAAYHHLLVTKDIEASAKLAMEVGVRDPDTEVRGKALAATELYLLYYKGDEESRALWKREYNSLTYQVGKSWEQWDPEEFLREHTDERARTAMLMAEVRAGSPFATASAQDAWLDALLYDMSRKVDAQK